MTELDKRRTAWLGQVRDLSLEKIPLLQKQQQGELTRQDALILGRINREISYYTRKLNQRKTTHLDVQTLNRRRIARELSAYAHEIRKITGRFPDGYRTVKA